jgi:pSer/pThr/pTyr-binding forkhead associated (FHA) protein/tetratricopeptide (TPR) repeat protein
VKLSVLKKNQLISEIDLSDLILDGTFSETIFLIGRSKECHIVLDDKIISREHSRLICLNGQWRVERISSDIPLLVNNEPVDSGPLVTGDSLGIGSFVINIDIPSKVAVDKLSIASKPYIAPVAEPIIKEAIHEIIPEEIQEITSEVTSELQDNSTGEFETESNKTGGTDVFSMDEITENKTEEQPSDFESFGTNSEIQIEEALESVEAVGNLDGESPSYSLENISNEESDSDGTKVYKNFSAVHLELFGEFTPYDKYTLEDGKTSIGRDPARCQITLNDPEVSSVHAVVTKNNMTMTLEDLNSGNGTLLNGERINKATLSHNDEFIIGGTSFKVKVNSDFLKEEHATLMPVDEDQTIEVEEVVEVQAEAGEHVNALGEISSSEPQEKSIIKRIWKNDENRKKLIYGLIVVVGAWVMFGDQEPPKKPVVVAKKDSKGKELKDEKSDKSDKADVKKATGKKLSDEERRSLSERYQIGKKHFYEGRYRDALEELQKIAAVDPYFNTGLLTLIASAKEGLAKLEEQEKKRKEEEAMAERRSKVKALVAKAVDYVKEHRADLAQDVFNEIAKLDPENIEVSRLKREMDDWTKEKQKKELEIVQKKKDRDDKVEKLKPGKTLFLQKEWFKASAKLDEFLRVKDMDEDLTKEASEMLKSSREEVSNSVLPLQGKAKSLMEGQDLKGAYEIYQQILKIEPSNTEALNAIGEIREQLTTKARKIYREAIISESLSLFQEAKDKFQEVQQVSPVDSDYYKKASDKLKDYLD